MWCRIKNQKEYMMRKRVLKLTRKGGHEKVPGKTWKITDNELFSYLGIRKRHITELPVNGAEFMTLERDLTKGKNPEKLIKKFESEGIAVSGTVVKEGEGNWRTTDENKRYTYTIKKENKKLNIYDDYSFEELIKKALLPF